MSAPTAATTELQTTLLADELKKARQRGLRELDLATRNQRPVEAPILELLARAHSGDQISVRVPLIERLLRDALETWQASGHRHETDLLRQLFFGPESLPLSKRRPALLLEQATRQSGLSKDAFDERRRAALQLFARFLLAYVPDCLIPSPDEPPAEDARPDEEPTPAAENEPRPETTVKTQGQDEPSEHWWSWKWASLGVVVLAFIGLNIIFPEQQADVTGKNYGSEGAVLVYPGVGTSAEDMTPQWTLEPGDRSVASCKTEGRTVRVEGDDGVTAESSVWLQLTWAMYLPLVFADIDRDDLANLPQC